MAQPGKFLPLYTLIEKEREEVPDLTIREDEEWVLHEPSRTLLIQGQGWPVVIPLRDQEWTVLSFFTRREQPSRDELVNALPRRYPKRERIVDTVTRVRLVVSMINRKIKPWGGYLENIQNERKYQFLRHLGYTTAEPEPWKFRREEGGRIFAIDPENLIILELPNVEGQRPALSRGSPTQIIVLLTIMIAPEGTPVTREKLLEAIKESNYRIKKILGIPLSREQHLTTVLNKLPTFLLENGFSFTIKQESGRFTLVRTTP
jgi:hypothetical protein